MIRNKPRLHNKSKRPNDTQHQIDFKDLRQKLKDQLQDDDENYVKTIMTPGE